MLSAGRIARGRTQRAKDYPVIGELARLLSPEQVAEVGLRMIVARDAAEFAHMWDEVWA